MTNNEMLLVMECAVAMVLTRKSDILHANLRSADFTVKPVWKSSVIGYDYGPLVYKNLTQRQKPGWIYE